MKAEANTPGSSIPTILDVMEAVSARLTDAVLDPTNPEELDAVTGAIAQVYGGGASTEAELSNLIIYARGCHEMAAVYRQQGNEDNADLYHAIGQDMLTKALFAVENLTVQSLDILGGRQ